MSAPHVLLLGGHGKVAMHLTPLLLARSWNVTSVIRNPEHENELLALKKGQNGNLNVLISSLDDVRCHADAQRILDAVSPDYVVWSAGAGGKGGPGRTIAVDQTAAKHMISVVYSSPRVTKFLLVSHLGSRRRQPDWMLDEDWERLQHLNKNILPVYARAKLDVDEYMTAMAARRNSEGTSYQHRFQSIILRPGLLTDQPATGRVQLGKTRGQGSVTREDVAIVADRLLARDDTEGWYDLLNGDESIDEAIERVVREKVDAVEGENVEEMIKQFSL